MGTRVYVETSVVSYLGARPSRDVGVLGRQMVTQQWWAERAHAFELVVSELVLEEAGRGDAGQVAARLAALVGLPVLRATEAASAMAEQLVASGLLPPEAAADAVHIAVAASGGSDYLLTWNCRHLANVALRRPTERVIEAAGWACPLICTPDELLEVEP